MEIQNAALLVCGSQLYAIKPRNFKAFAQALELNGQREFSSVELPDTVRHIDGVEYDCNAAVVTEDFISKVPASWYWRMRSAAADAADELPAKYACLMMHIHQEHSRIAA